jgi:ankyrin repeat protein
MSIEELCMACVTGDNKAVAGIIARGEVDVNSQYSGGTTPLMYAMQYNYPSIVTSLLAYLQTKLDWTNADGYTGLHWACCFNSHSVIALFGQDRRCIPGIVNIRDNDGITPLMFAVERGYLDCVKKLDGLEGTDFQTKNSQAETLIEVGRKKKHATVVQYLLERIGRVVEDVASNNLERMNLRDLAEEIDNLKEIEAVMESEKDVIHEKHVKENEKIIKKQELEREQLHARHDEENESMRNKQREELAENERIMFENREKKSNLERRLQSRLVPAAATGAAIAPAGIAPSPEAPKCPMCIEEMKPPMQICNCRNGHLICGDCMPKVACCTNCRTKYLGRATAVEQMLRQTFGQH